MPRAKSQKKSPEPSSNAASLPRQTSRDISWIRTLATPYLRGYCASAVLRGALRGYRFVPPGKGRVRSNAGFFVGYLVEPGPYNFLQPATPECLVFAFLGPAGSVFHEEMVAREGSPLRKMAEYIGWLTHRPPRFAFFSDQEVVLVRHLSMRAWSAAKHQHFSRNFFIETLAWLVRSGLVAKLRAESAMSQSASVYGKRKK